MGKRIISQRRGRGTSTYRAHSFRYRAEVKYRKYDDYEKNSVIDGKVIDILHCPGHTAPLMHVQYANGERMYLLAPENIRVESIISSGINAPAKIGNTLPLKNIPAGTDIYNIEINPGDGGKLIRSSGTSAKIVGEIQGMISIELPSRKKKLFLPSCRATIGKVAGGGRPDKPFVKAGKRHHDTRARGKLYPRTSGVAMNAVDHPFGSGRGRHIGKSKTAPRDAPPGRKVGLIRPRRTGYRR